MEIWCNEAQERYVLALVPGSVPQFAALCERERCPFAVVGEITGDGRLLVTDSLLSATPVDMPIEVLLGKAPRVIRDVRTAAKAAAQLSTAGSTIDESLDRLLHLPAIADKSFLITIGDRTVGGMIARDHYGGAVASPRRRRGRELEQLRGFRLAGDGHGLGLDASSGGIECTRLGAACRR